MQKRTLMRWMFLHYAYLTNWLHILLDLSPPPLRTLLHRVILGHLGKSVFIDTNVYFRYPGRVCIGNDVSINRGCQFYPSWHDKNATITLGDNIRLGPNVCFFAAGHDHSQLNLPDTAAPIVVGRDVWIGGNSTILQGVSIGEGAVIAAGSVVNRDIPPFKIYGGIPAKELKSRMLIQSQSCSSVANELHG